MTSRCMCFVALALALVATASPALAANHYIHSGATGNGSGSDWANACTDFSGLCAVSSLVRGDTYYMASGTYAGRSFNTATSGATIITIKKATVADHGTTTGWQDSYATGQAAFSNGITFLTSYWTLDGMTGGGPGSWNSGFGFKITETGDSVELINVGGPGLDGTVNNITVRHVDMQGKGSVSTSGGSTSNDAVAVWNDNNNTFSYIWMHGIGRCPFYYFAGSNNLMEYIYVDTFYGSSSTHSEVMSSGGTGGLMGDTTFRYSLITAQPDGSTGSLLWDNHGMTSSHLYVYGNVWYDPPGVVWNTTNNGLIGGWTGGGGEQEHNILVYNNSFVNIPSGQNILSSAPNIFSGNQAYNNIFYNTPDPNFAEYPHDYNQFINAGGTYSEAHGTSGTTNPFTNISAIDFALTGDTSAGMTLSSPTGVTLDPLGVTRGANGVWDRGAYQYVLSSGSAPTPPSGLTALVQ